MITDSDALAMARDFDRRALADILGSLDTLQHQAVRTQVQTLLTARALARADVDAWTLRVPRKVYRDAERVCMRISLLLDAARREAMKDFCDPHAWKFEGNLGVAELHTQALSLTWCETCGGLCHGDPPGRIFTGPRHDGGQHDAFRARRGYRGRTEAVIQHTRHPFESCVAFGALFQLKVARLEWSWYGAPTAALFSRCAV